MVHLVYKITNTNTEEYYIGVHSTLNINDGYMGSGTRIRKAIKEYGVKNFKKEILHQFESRAEALKKEAEIVNDQLLKDLLCYNLISGGGGFPFCKWAKIDYNTFDRGKLTRFDLVYYEFKLRRNFIWQTADDRLLTSLYKVLTPEFVIKYLNLGWNSIEYHDSAVKFRRLLDSKMGFNDNLYLIEREWQEQEDQSFLMNPQPIKYVSKYLPQHVH